MSRRLLLHLDAISRVTYVSEGRKYPVAYRVLDKERIGDLFPKEGKKIGSES